MAHSTATEAGTITLSGELERLAVLLGYSIDIANRAEQVAEMLSGPSPAPADSDPTILPSGHLFRLHALLDDLQATQDRANYALKRTVDNLGCSPPIGGSKLELTGRSTY